MSEIVTGVKVLLWKYNNITNNIQNSYRKNTNLLNLNAGTSTTLILVLFKNITVWPIISVNINVLKSAKKVAFFFCIVVLLFCFWDLNSHPLCLISWCHSGAQHESMNLFMNFPGISSCLLFVWFCRNTIFTQIRSYSQSSWLTPPNMFSILQGLASNRSPLVQQALECFIQLLEENSPTRQTVEIFFSKKWIFLKQ